MNRQQLYNQKVVFAAENASLQAHFRKKAIEEKLQAAIETDPQNFRQIGELSVALTYTTAYDAAISEILKAD